MKLEEQVCSLELAKRLEELGVKQKSLFAWGTVSGSLGNDRRAIITGTYTVYPTQTFNLTAKEIEQNGLPVYSAFTTAELGEMLPGNDGECCFIIQKGLMGNQWYCTRCRLTDMKDMHQEIADTEANVRAKMLIYLLENNLITPASQDKE